MCVGVHTHTWALILTGSAGKAGSLTQIRLLDFFFFSYFLCGIRIELSFPSFFLKSGWLVGWLVYYVYNVLLACLPAHQKMSPDIIIVGAGN